MRRVFREYKVLLISSRTTAGFHQEMLTPLGFGQIVVSHDDKKALNLIKQTRPDLVVAGRSVGVFSGAQLLSAARSDRTLDKVPFIIVGDRDDLKPGGLADQVRKSKLAGFATLPSGQEEFNRSVLEFLDPLIDPKHEKALLLIDISAEKVALGQLEEAAGGYQEAMDLYPTHLPGWLKLAGVLADLEKNEQAEQAYFRALRLDNYSLESYFGLAELYERNEDYDQTIGVLNQALGIAQIMKMSAKSVSRINFFIGEFELRLKRLTGAAEAFDQAIASAPQDSELRTDIGDAYAGKGYWAEAEEHYVGALKIDPNLAHVFNRLGIAYRRQQKFDKALDLYDNARLHHPEDENLLFNMARAHFEASRPKEAEMYLEEALLMSPQFREAKSLIAKLKDLTLGELPENALNKGP